MPHPKKKKLHRCKRCMEWFPRKKVLDAEDPKTEKKYKICRGCLTGKSGNQGLTIGIDEPDRAWNRLLCEAF